MPGVGLTKSSSANSRSNRLIDDRRPSIALLMKQLYQIVLWFIAVLVIAGCRSTISLPTPAAVATVPGQAFQPDLVPTPLLATPTAILIPSSTEPPEPSPTASPEAEPATPDPQLSESPEPEPSPTPEPVCDQPGYIERSAIESAVAGEPMAYRIYFPPCYGQDEHAYPTLYIFGGNIHDDGIWDALGLDEATEAAITAGAIPPLLIVMPDNGWLANTTTSGPASYEGFVLNELIPHIENTYCAWAEPAGRAVGGLSRGGYWSLMMAFRRADLFRSVGAHSPALIDSYAGPAEDPAITGVTNNLGDLRIRLDIGERDPFLVQARPLHEALAGAGVPHEWHINPGTHEEAYWRERVGEYLAWYSDGWAVERTVLPVCANLPGN
jgi:enterochelin esterase-like enzyme